LSGGSIYEMEMKRAGTRLLSEIVQRVRHGRLKTNIGSVTSLDDAVAAINSIKRVKGKTIIRVRS
jgi:NADPH:quinone reductase-like Zn-dependent oxidoreductase